MKKAFFSIIALATILFIASESKAQTFKVAVFDIDYMVQAMPEYAKVDSLLQIYQRDSLGAEYEVYSSEFQRLDSTYKADSALVAQGKKSKSLLDYTSGERQKMGMNLVYWQQIAQGKSEQKRGQLAQPLYEKVVEAYKKVLAAKKYNLVLRPQSYEQGFPIDNLFIAVAKELKLTSLPQELLFLGDDPDAKPGTTPPAGGTKPVTKP